MDECPHTQAQGRTIVLVHCSSQCAVVVVISLLWATLALFTPAEKQPVAEKMERTGYSKSGNVAFAFYTPFLHIYQMLITKE